MTETKETAAHSLCDSSRWEKLIRIMARLRGEGGCPWDLKQTHDSLKRYLLEESYEVLDAIDRKSDASLCDELGDVLLQVVFHAQIAAEQGRFTIDDVVDAINNKMIRRHPHIFGQGVEAKDAEQVLTMWEAIKAQEKSGDGQEKRGLMDVNTNMPALMLAQKVQEKAARVGFDWPDSSGAEAKLQEEIAEFQAAITPEEQLDELGDVLFATVNVARMRGLVAEEAMRHASDKFINRFRYIEDHLAEHQLQWGEASLEQLDQLWDEAKERGL